LGRHAAARQHTPVSRLGGRAPLAGSLMRQCRPPPPSRPDLLRRFLLVPPSTSDRLRLHPDLRDLLWSLCLWPLLLFLWIGRIHVCRVGYLNQRNLPIVQFGMHTFPLLVNHLVLLKLLKILDGRLQWMRNMML
jgi:hypothetical protein